MKLGIVISLIVVIFFGIIGFVSFRGVAEPPTPASRPEKLVKQILPAILPKLIAPAEPAADATVLYQQAFDYYEQNKTELSTDPPQQDLSRQVADFLIAASQKGRVKAGFLDQRSPMESDVKASDDEALKSVAHATLIHAEDMAQFGEPERARQAAMAVWSLGYRTFQDNVLMDYRWQGLSIMLESLATLSNLSERDEAINQDKIWSWLSAVQGIDTAWQSKYELVAQVRPHIGDLVNVAKNDKDITFRVESILKLGIAKFAPGTRGNHRHIISTLEEASLEEHPMIQRAAKAALAMTKEDLQKVY